MNKAESRQMASHLDCLGYQATGMPSEAAVIVLNTCVVRQSAEDKVLGTLGYVKGLKKRYPELSILVTGCFVDSNIEELKRRFPYVDLFFRPGDYAYLDSWARRQDIASSDHETEGAMPSSSPCAFVPIIQGCDNFCSYCIVPYRRGRQVSRPLEETVCEVKRLVQRGVKEITLLGQNVDSYGHDLPGHSDLADLLTELNGIDGLVRIRFLTNHPKDMSLKLIRAMASLDKVCEHLELPIQAGDNDILKAMRRGYTVEQYQELVSTIRHQVPQISLSTDIIIGFPGETEEQFERTFSLLQETKFDAVHVAAYSPRPGTIASRKYQDNVAPEAKRERLNRIEQLQAGVAAEINSQLQGKVVEVLVEGKKKGRWYGRTRTDKLVFFDNDTECLGQLVEVKIDRASPWALQGDAIL